MLFRSIDGHRILLGAHIDDFVIACANRPVLDAFRTRLLEAFEGTYEGPLEHDAKLLVTPSPALLLFLKSITPKRFAMIWILGHSTAQHTYET